VLRISDDYQERSLLVVALSATIDLSLIINALARGVLPDVGRLALILFDRVDMYDVLRPRHRRDATPDNRDDLCPPSSFESRRLTADSPAWRPPS
jgi:hypothetical protein